MPESSMVFLALVIVSFGALFCVGTVAAVVIGAFRRGH